MNNVLPIGSKYDNIIENVDFINGLYLLTYENKLDWINTLNVLICLADLVYIPKGNAYADNKNLSIYGENKIIETTILLGNPELNNYLNDTIMHELRHLYNYMKKINNIRILNTADIDYYDNLLIKDIDIIHVDRNLYNIILNDERILLSFIGKCFYYLNADEMQARQENIYNEILKLVCNNKNISLVEIMLKTDTIILYNNIRSILKFLISNELVEAEKIIFNDDKILQFGNKNLSYLDIIKLCANIENKSISSLKFLYKVFLNKINTYIFKHIAKMLNTIKLQIL